jgi:uncharacterized ion transporter superfamily protein YfcC
MIKDISKLKVIPDSLVIVFIITILMAALTWILPSGKYQRFMVNNREVVVPDSFTRTDAKPQKFYDVIRAPIKGFTASSYLLAFILFVGGAFHVFSKTGALEALLANVLNWCGRNPKYKYAVIPVLLSFFALCASTFGLSELALVMLVFTIPLSISLGFDSLLGMAIPLVGTAVGYGGSITNPFTIAIAQNLANVELYSGMGFRLVSLVVYISIASFFLIRYAYRLETKAIVSPVIEIDKKHHFDAKISSDLVITWQTYVIVGLFVFTLLLIVLGAIYLGWGFYEIAALFISLGLFSGILADFSTSQMMEYFYEGAKAMVYPCFIVAFSRGIVVVATDGLIIDSIIYYGTELMKNFQSLVSVEIMFVLQSLINVILPSGSGQASLTIPILAPMSDILGISRQLAVLVFQFGDGLNNMIIPTSGVTMGALAIAKIPYPIWIRWLWPMMLTLVLVAMILLVLAYQLGY